MKLFKSRKPKQPGASAAATHSQRPAKKPSFLKKIAIFRNTRIATKLLAGFLVIALLGVALGLYASLTLNESSASSSRMYKEMLLPMRQIYDMSDSFQKERTALYSMLINKNDIMFEAYKSAIGNADSSMRASIGMMKGLIASDAVFYVDKLQAAIEDLKPKMDAAIQSVGAGNKDAVIEDLSGTGDLYTSMSQVLSAISVLSTAATNKAASQDTDNKKSAERVQLITNIAIPSVLLLSLVIGILIARSISRPVKKLTRAFNLLAAGETEFDHVVARSKSEVGQMGAAFESIVASIRKLSEDTDLLIRAAKEGRLSVRADAEAHQGSYRKIVEGINETLDAVTLPVGEAARVLGEVSHGNLNVRVAGNFLGDHAIIQNSLNTTIDTLKELVDDTHTLIQAAVAGQLSVRASVGKHEGAFKKIIEGVNETLDAVILPVTETVQVLEEVARGNLQVCVTGDYQGDHAILKDNLNETIRILNGYIREMSTVLGEIAEGNLNTGIASEYKGDFIAFKEAINRIVQSLNHTLSEIMTAADQMASGTRQLSDGSQLISQGAAEQAGAIDSLTATMAQIAAQTRQNASSAHEASEASVKAKNNAGDGNRMIQDMQTAMEEINTASASISAIIREIDAIAFQTNILALNAAVEAAHAGTHGKGFAVVAEEVRALAARSAKAAQETTSLIEGSIHKTQAGAKIADDTAAAFAQIVSGVENAVALVGNIASASGEQAEGIAQVNRSIGQMSQVVQASTATVEESAASAEELSAQAELLREMVGRFRLKAASVEPASSGTEGSAGYALPYHDGFGKY